MRAVANPVTLFTKVFFSIACANFIEARANSVALMIVRLVGYSHPHPGKMSREPIGVRGNFFIDEIHTRQ